MAVTCRDCAIPYEEWPDGGCPNCRSPEPAPEPTASRDDADTGDGPGTTPPPFDGEQAGGSPTVAAPPARTRAGRRGGGRTGGGGP